MSRVSFKLFLYAPYWGNYYQETFHQITLSLKMSKTNTCGQTFKVLTNSYWVTFNWIASLPPTDHYSDDRGIFRDSHNSVSTFRSWTLHFLTLCLMNFFKEFIHFLCKDFNRGWLRFFFLCFRYIAILRGCQGRIAVLFGVILLLLTAFLCLHLGIRAWEDYNSRCWSLVLYLWNVCVFLDFCFLSSS